MLENPEARTIWKRIWSLSTWLDPNCCTDVRRLWDFSTDDETTDKKLDEKERLLLYNCPSSPKGYVSPLSYTICMQIYIILEFSVACTPSPFIAYFSHCQTKFLDDQFSTVCPEMDSYTFSVLSNGLISYKWGIFMNNWRYFYLKKHTLFRFGQNWQS